MGGRPILFSAVLTILALAAVLVGCSGERQYARLPDNVSAAIVYNEQNERWHAAAIVAGDRPQSSLRVLCLTEEGKPEEHPSRGHTGLNIDASPGERRDGESTWSSSSISPSEITDPESVWGRQWAWQLDGQPWEGGRWSMSNNTRPANLVAENEEVESAFFVDLQRAKTAELIGSKDEADDITIAFDLTRLFSTPLQFAIDDCDSSVIEQRTSDYHSAYAYWHPVLERHWITMSVPELSGQAGVYLICAPTAFYDETPGWLSTPSWLSPKGDDSVALIANIHLEEEDRFTGEVSVQWSSNTVGREFAQWEVRDGSLSPDSHRSNLKLYDALRRSAVLDFVVRQDGADDLRLQIGGATALSAPLTSILHGCVQEYADAYEQ